MPVLRPCRQFRCPALVPSGWCPLHRRPIRPDCDRPSSTARGYGRRWRKIRLMYLRANPICVACERAASEVDHITPKRAGGEDDDENLQALCKSCHSIKTAGERHSMGFKGPQTAVAMRSVLRPPGAGQILEDRCQ